MYYIIRRKGNYFSKSIFEQIFGKDSLQKAIDNKHVEKASNGYYRGINNNEDRQWRRIPDLYNRSGARRFMHTTVPLRKANELGIDISMAITSGFVLQTTDGLIYDNGQFRPVYPPSKEFDKSDNVIARTGNQYSVELVNMLSIDKALLKYEPDTNTYKGLVDDDLSKILTFENHTLIGVPYIMLDQLYTGKVTSFSINKKNIQHIKELIYSGHVYTRGNKIYLDNQDIKRHKYYNWVGRNIYCMS